MQMIIIFKTPINCIPIHSSKFGRIKQKAKIRKRKVTKNIDFISIAQNYINKTNSEHNSEYNSEHDIGYDDYHMLSTDFLQSYF